MRTRTWTLSPINGDADSLSVHNGYGQIDPEPSLPGEYVSVSTPSLQCLELWITYSFEDTTTVDNPIGGMDVALASGSAEDSYHFIEDYVEPGVPGYFFVRGAWDTAELDYLADYVWGTRQRMHAIFEGGRIRANRWLDGDAEPDGWMLTSGDLAHVFREPIDRTLIESWGGQTIRVYEFILCPLITDTFERTESSGWGTTTGNTATAWTTYGPASVDGEAGLLTREHDPGNVAPYVYLGWTPPETAPDPPLDVVWTCSIDRALGPHLYGESEYGEVLRFYVDAGNPPAVIFSGEKGLRIIESSISEAGSWIAIPVDMTATFNLRISCLGPDEPTNVWVWAATDDQPTTPTLAKTLVDFYNSSKGVIIEDFNLYPEGEHAASDLTLRVESLDIVGSESWA